jgi:ABC-2 type transport system ATP-binding protein
MQEVEATCSRLVILSQGRLAAEGAVQDLLSKRSGGARYVVEADGSGVAEALATLAGVVGHSSESTSGRTRVTLDAAEEVELRPAIFGMARDRGWTLWELHRERASLEQLFRSLTAESAPAPEAEAQPSDATTDEVNA